MKIQIFGDRTLLPATAIAANPLLAYGPRNAQASRRYLDRLGSGMQIVNFEALQLFRRRCA
jgi:hypothetical protein